jgi:hypothetical protein
MPDDETKAPLTAITGIGADDLPALMRQMFDQCVADARVLVDPAADFDAFVEALWEQVDAAFGITRQEWPEGAPQPWPALVDEQRGVAEAVLEGGLEPGDLSS